ncbi:MAG TPA: uroporphyrinogen decarboxylase family protein [Candidatus Hydrogenedentes bacterium]|nr:uroporphyrinogen decarboxylase family protein [Candidatus Hydrogenedentota bacterium]
MNARDRLKQWYAGNSVPPPLLEAEFAEGTLEAWAQRKLLTDCTAEAFFGIDRQEEMELTWRRVPEEKSPLVCKEDLPALLNAYDPRDARRFPPDWPSRVETWKSREHLLFASPWNEGLFQILGISNGASLDAVLRGLCERPVLAEAAMEHYAQFLVDFLDRLLPQVEVDFAILYEPIASNHASVISADMYRHFAFAALRRVMDCLDRHGVRLRVMWSTGAVQAFIPVWLDAGVTGLNIEECGRSGISYNNLRKTFGKGPVLFGGIDWRTVASGPTAIDELLEQQVRPLLEQGRHIPYLDDSIRIYMPFDAFCYYRLRLNRLLEEVFA